MNFEESTINTIHQQRGFDQLYIEKVLRLLEILELFFSHPVLKDKYALKGGTALNLFYFNYSLKDISDMLKMNESTVKSHLQRLKKELKSFLSGKGYDI